MTRAPSIFVCVDGADGTGKSTLIEQLALELGGRFIALRRSSETGFIPSHFVDRVAYFRKTDPFLAARAYIGAHMARFSDAILITKRLHWRAQMVSRAEGPLVIVADRGPRSVAAYAWATLCMDDTIDGDIAWDWVLQQAQLLRTVTIDIELLLAPTISSMSVSKQLLARTGTLPNDQAREVRLIDLQLQAFDRPTPYSWPSVAIDPFQPEASVTASAIRALEKYISPLAPPASTRRVLLSDLLKLFRRSVCPGLFRGRVWLCRGIVEKGYTDNDVDVIAEWHEDIESLSSILHNVELHHLHVTPETEAWVLALPTLM